MFGPLRRAPAGTQMLPRAGWGSTSASPGSRFIQHKGNAGPGLVFHLLDLGCNVCFSAPARSPRLGGLPFAGCKHSTIHTGFSLCSCSLGNLYVAAGDGTRLRAATTLGWEMELPLPGFFTSRLSCLPVGFLEISALFLSPGYTTCASGLWCPPF